MYPAYTGVQLLYYTRHAAEVNRTHLANSTSLSLGGTTRFFFGAGRLCLDFTRTVRSRGCQTIEGLASPADLVRWITESCLPTHSVRCNVTTEHLDVARQLREAVYRMLVAAISPQRASPKGRSSDRLLVNRCAMLPPPVPQLGPDQRSVSWKTECSPEAALALIARDAIELLGSQNITRVRECADPNCTSLFFDSSRPGMRRWCSAMPCANRHKVRSHRARQAQQQTLGAREDESRQTES
ncbi:MAG: CGNR zinc finger domain-containing protein [Gemmatimonadaceae bacterium]